MMKKILAVIALSIIVLENVCWSLLAFCVASLLGNAGLTDFRDIAEYDIHEPSINHCSYLLDMLVHFELFNGHAIKILITAHNIWPLMVSGIVKLFSIPIIFSMITGILMEDSFFPETIERIYPAWEMTAMLNILNDVCFVYYSDLLNMTDVKNFFTYLVFNPTLDSTYAFLYKCGVYTYGFLTWVGMLIAWNEFCNVVRFFAAVIFNFLWNDRANNDDNPGDWINNLRLPNRRQGNGILNVQMEGRVIYRAHQTIPEEVARFLRSYINGDPEGNVVHEISRRIYQQMTGLFNKTAEQLENEIKQLHEVLKTQAVSFRINNRDVIVLQCAICKYINQHREELVRENLNRVNQEEVMAGIADEQHGNGDAQQGNGDAQQGNGDAQQGNGDAQQENDNAQHWNGDAQQGNDAPQINGVHQINGAQQGNDVQQMND